MILQVGQRWVADTDSSLGLGMVLEFDRRKLTLEFPATGETRVYGRGDAPLTRVVFSVGDTIETLSGQSYEVEQVEQVNDLSIYLTKEGEAVVETQLSPTIELRHPQKRLLANQLDKPYWFDFRCDLSEGYQRWYQSNTIGLLGARIMLTPHQLYVAAQATSQLPVRVLLADEVGLGKTIEAGLILHRLMLQQQAQRVLIIVPEALQVQWFVELLRRFNIKANLYDKELVVEDTNVLIVSHSALTPDVDVVNEVWDCVIIDEAHHFSVDDGSDQSESIQVLAMNCEHLLLLSATPERMGMEEHFHRLKLIDSSRFSDFKTYKKQLAHYSELANKLSSIEVDAPLTQDVQAYLSEQFPNEPIDKLDNEAIVSLLLDCYGTGRSVFRNTRQSVQGFPARQLMIHPSVDDMTQKYEWLSHYIQANPGQKTLLITKNIEDVLAIKTWLYQSTGQDCPVFHEQMSLLERDRAAAYFAEDESTAPLLICSEIGGEGRNFQFCHHLICWDLPEHPDVLEQRIGRLDRIGQTDTITLHVCPKAGSGTEEKLAWYHGVLNCIECSNPAAGAIHNQYFEDYLKDKSVAEQAQQAMNALLNELEQGRDKLLEINSCPPQKAEQWVNQVRDDEIAYQPQTIIEQAVDLLNLHYEQLDYHRFSVIPSDQMLLPSLAGIPAEGCEITYHRDTALAREDVQLMTWDHPFLQGLVDLMGQSPMGTASVALFPIKTLPPGKLLVEAAYTLTVQSAHKAEATRYLESASIRVLCYEQANTNLSAMMPRDSLSSVIEPARKDICHTIVRDYRPKIESLIKQSLGHAENEQASIISTAIKAIERDHQMALARLTALERRNSQSLDTDKQSIDDHYQQLIDSLSTACQPVLTAVRVLVTYQPEF